MNDRESLACAALIMAAHAPMLCRPTSKYPTSHYWCSECLGDYENLSAGEENLSAGEFRNLDEWADHVVEVLWPDLVSNNDEPRPSLRARLREMWMQFWDNPFTMFDRSKPDRDHNTMTGSVEGDPR